MAMRNMISHSSLRPWFSLCPRNASTIYCFEKIPSLKSNGMRKRPCYHRLKPTTTTTNDDDTSTTKTTAIIITLTPPTWWLCAEARPARCRTLGARWWFSGAQGCPGSCMCAHTGAPGQAGPSKSRTDWSSDWSCNREVSLLVRHYFLFQFYKTQACLPH